MMIFELRSTDAEELSEMVDHITDRADECWGVELSWIEGTEGETCIAKVDVPDMDTVVEVVGMLNEIDSFGLSFEDKTEMRVYPDKE